MTTITPHRHAFVVGVLALGALATTVRAQGDETAPSEQAAPANYVAGMVSTTLGYRPPGGPFDGPQEDVTPMVGLGRFVTSSVALELDVGPTFIKGDYASVSLMPGVVWTFKSYAYVSARFIIPVDPDLNLAIAPGVGLTHALNDRITPFLEVNAVSYVGKGDPDFGISVTVGVLCSF